MGNTILRLQPQPDGLLLASVHSDACWTQILQFPLKHRNDGWFASDQNPLEAMKVVDAGGTQYILRRSVTSDVTPVRVTITTTGAWRIYDPAFKGLANRKGSGVISLPAGSGLGYMTLFGDPGQSITVAVQ